MDYDKKLTEKLNCIRNEMTHLWGSVFILGGGSISLFFKHTIEGYITGTIGVIFAIILAYSYFIRREEH